jgi:hypothetical protein
MCAIAAVFKADTGNKFLTFKKQDNVPFIHPDQIPYGKQVFKKISHRVVLIVLCGSIL